MQRGGTARDDGRRDDPVKPHRDMGMFDGQLEKPCVETSNQSERKSESSSCREDLNLLTCRS